LNSIDADSSFVPPMVYAVLGSSRDLAVGPVSISSLIMGSMLRQAVSPTAEPMLFLQLAFTATLFAGIFQASLGILRLVVAVLTHAGTVVHAMHAMR
jgi:sulfate transporter 3